MSTSIPTRLESSPAIAYGVGIFGVLSLASYYVKKALERCRLQRRHVDRAQDEVTSMRQAVEGKEAEISALKKSLGAVHRDTKSKEDEVKRLKEEMRQMRSLSTDLGNQLAGSRDQEQTLNGHLERQAKEVKTVKDELQMVKLAHTQTIELLKTRTLELEGAQTFLSKIDNFAGADVTKMLELLNSEILQTAAFMAESFEYENIGQQGHEDEGMVRASQLVGEVLGTRMAELLKSWNHNEELILVQVALQAAMCVYAEWIMTSWSFHDSETENLLNEIYDSLRESEEQAVAGRWRVLTRTYLQKLLGEPTDMSAHFITAFADILTIAGAKGVEGQLQEMIATKFSERIAVVVQSSIRLNRVLGEGVTSCELLPIQVNAGSAFDISTMDDSFGKRLGEYSEDVLCTTDLGLLRAGRLQGEPGSWDNRVLLKPKVILQSGLDEVNAGEDAA